MSKGTNIINVVEDKDYSITDEQLAELIRMRQGAREVSDRASTDYFRCLMKRTQNIVATQDLSPYDAAVKAHGNMYEVVKEQVLTKDMYPKGKQSKAKLVELREQRQKATAFARSASSEWNTYITDQIELSPKGAATVIGALVLSDWNKSKVSKANAAARKARQLAAGKGKASDSVELGPVAKGKSHGLVYVTKVLELLKFLEMDNRYDDKMKANIQRDMIDTMTRWAP